MNQQAVNEAREAILNTVTKQFENLDPHEKLEVIREVSNRLTEIEWEAEDDANAWDAEDEEEE